MSNTEKMVSVPREQLEKIREWIESARDGVLYPIARDFDGVVGRNAEGLGQETPSIMDGIDELLTKPAEQSQGEPVALPERKQPRPQGDWTSPETYRENLGWNACLDEIAKLGPLYTYADPGEVERLRAEVEKQRRLKMHVAENLQNALNNCSVYRQQLTEQAALLQLGLAMINRGIVSFDDQIEYRQKLAALFASAEPIPDHSVEANKKVERDEPKSCDEANQENAPTFMGEPNPHHPIEWYREGIHKHWKTICNQRQKIDVLSSALKFYADRDHYHFESDNWDTVSGEPLNILWHSEEPDFVEDGQIARSALEKSYE